jgi:hypothetical protein
VPGSLVRRRRSWIDSGALVSAERPSTSQPSASTLKVRGARPNARVIASRPASGPSTRRTCTPSGTRAWRKPLSRRTTAFVGRPSRVTEAGAQVPLGPGRGYDAVAAALTSISAIKVSPSIRMESRLASAQRSQAGGMVSRVRSSPRSSGGGKSWACATESEPVAMEAKRNSAAATLAVLEGVLEEGTGWAGLASVLPGGALGRRSTMKARSASASTARRNDTKRVSQGGLKRSSMR